MRTLEGVTPKEVATLVRDLITDKTVCDVGCGEGNFMEALSVFARQVIGIEEEEEWARKAAEKGFDVICGNSFFEPLPPAEVFYLWSKDAMGIFLKAREEGTKGTFIFGKTVRPSLVAFLDKIKAERRDLKELDWWVYITKL